MAWKKKFIVPDHVKVHDKYGTTKLQFHVIFLTNGIFSLYLDVSGDRQPRRRFHRMLEKRRNFIRTASLCLRFIFFWYSLKTRFVNSTSDFPVTSSPLPASKCTLMSSFFSLLSRRETSLPTKPSWDKKASGYEINVTANFYDSHDHIFEDTPCRHNSQTSISFPIVLYGIW